MHYVLTRLTTWVEMGASNGEVDPTERFLMRRSGDRDFEIEHLFTSRASKYAHKVSDARYYGYLRNRIGALLLVDGPDNGSYGGMLLEDKLVHYRKDTRLAGMLNPDFFRRGNTRLRKFLSEQGLFQMVTTYDASTALKPFIEARGQFYYEMAKRIWSLDALELAPPAPAAPGPTATGKRTRYGVRFKDLVQAGFISTDDRLIGHRRNRLYYARVRPDGNIETASGFVATAPTKAMEDAVGVASNGWAFWQVERTRERLDTVRQRYLDHFGR